MCESLRTVGHKYGMCAVLQEVMEQKRREADARSKKSNNAVQKRNDMLQKRTEEQRR